MRVCIHQPQFIPYLGFFNKVAQCDTYVILDDVKGTKGDFTNRNRIKDPSGQIWLTIPVKSKNTLIKDMKISMTDYPWAKKHLKSIYFNYIKAPYFDSFFSDIEKICNEKKWEKIIDIDIEFIRWCFKILKIDVKMIISSDLDVKSSKSQKLVDICKKVGADSYLSGVGGKNYLDSNLFNKEGIKVEFQDFKHPIYPQLFGEFIPNLSIIDMILNCGDRSRNFLGV